MWILSFIHMKSQAFLFPENKTCIDVNATLYKSRDIESTLMRRCISHDRCIDVNATLYKRHVSTGMESYFMYEMSADTKKKKKKTGLDT